MNNPDIGADEPSPLQWGRVQRRGLEEYQEFRREFARRYPGASRAELSAAWRAHKEQPPQPAVFTDADVDDLLLDFETDAKALHRELLQRSQANPNCYPYGLSLQDLGSLDKLRETVRKVRRRG